MSLTTKIKMSYKTEKQMKKMMGKLTGYQIAFGRKLCKMIKSNYSQPERLNPETQCVHDWFHPPLSDYKQCSKCGEQTGMNYVRCESLSK